MTVPGAQVTLADLPLRDDLRGKSPTAHHNSTCRSG